MRRRHRGGVKFGWFSHVGGAVKGPSMQPVKVRSEEVSVHLGSYPGGGEADRTADAPGTSVRPKAGWQACGPQHA